jgi:hypothetical protein
MPSRYQYHFRYERPTYNCEILKFCFQINVRYINILLNDYLHVCIIIIIIIIITVVPLWDILHFSNYTTERYAIR